MESIDKTLSPLMKMTDLLLGTHFKLLTEECLVIH